MTVAASLETMPLFVRAGSIVPTGPVKQYVGEFSIRAGAVDGLPGRGWTISTLR